MRGQYYYQVAGLPDVALDERKSFISFRETAEAMAAEFTGEDQRHLRLLRHAFDNQNLLGSLLKRNAPFNPNGVFDPAVIAAAPKNTEGFPEYMVVFTEAFLSDRPIFPGFSWEDQLSRLYYDTVFAQGNVFLREWFAFDQDLRNVLAGLNCRKYKRSPDFVVIGTGPVAEAVRKSQAPDFGLAVGMPWVGAILGLPADDPVEAEKRIDQLRFRILDELSVFHYFSAERCFAHLIKLSLAERWQALLPAAGRELFEQFVSARRPAVGTAA